MKRMLGTIVASMAVLALTWAVIAREEPAVPKFEAGADGKVQIFNGKDLEGWDAEAKYWRVENGEIVGQARDRNNPYSYCVTKRAVGDFRLVFQVKLVPNEGNSGVQFRSIREAKDRMTGPQADIGKGWWGHLYDEHGKALVTKKSGEQFVKPGDWNLYEIVAVGSKVKLAINGNACNEIDDKDLRTAGVIGLQIHSGGPMEVRFKELVLELDPREATLTTVKK